MLYPLVLPFNFSSPQILEETVNSWVRYMFSNSVQVPQGEKPGLTEPLGAELTLSLVATHGSYPHLVGALSSFLALRKPRTVWNLLYSRE